MRGWDTGIFNTPVAPTPQYSVFDNRGVIVNKTVIGQADVTPVEFAWGRITWLHNGEAGAKGLTVGEVIINPGQSNPMHTHPNCEEVLYLISGELDHTYGPNEIYHLTSGMSIRVPAGIKHNAVCTSAEPARMIVAYDSAYREMVGE
jgi:quercetin dioxygenase-like cupin family protein